MSIICYAADTVMMSEVTRTMTLMDRDFDCAITRTNIVAHVRMFYYLRVSVMSRVHVDAYVCTA